MFVGLFCEKKKKKKKTERVKFTNTNTSDRQNITLPILSEPKRPV